MKIKFKELSIGFLKIKGFLFFFTKCNYIIIISYKIHVVMVQLGCSGFDELQLVRKMVVDRQHVVHYYYHQKRVHNFPLLDDNFLHRFHVVHLHGHYENRDLQQEHGFPNILCRDGQVHYKLHWLRRLSPCLFGLKFQKVLIQFFF